MCYQVELFVKLKIPDVTAITARNTLQRRLNYAAVLRDLQREDYWALTVQAEGEEAARSLGTELAERTNIFVNPNKHTYRLNIRRVSPCGGESGSPAPEVPSDSPETTVIQVLTGFLGDASANLTQEALQGRLGYGQVIRKVERGTLWTLILNTWDGDQACRWAEEMILTRGGSQGLLVNPHSQWWRWM